MNGGITKVRCEGIPTVRGVNALEVLRYLVKRFVPSDAFPTVRSAADGIFEPVLIVMKILQRHGLRADVPAAERVVLVTADVQTLVGLNSDFNATNRFAEIAGSIMRGAIVSGSHGAKVRSTDYADYTAPQPQSKRKTTQDSSGGGKPQNTLKKVSVCLRSEGLGVGQIENIGFSAPKLVTS